MCITQSSPCTVESGLDPVDKQPSVMPIYAFHAVKVEKLGLNPP